MGYLDTPEGKEDLRKIHDAVVEQKRAWEQQAADYQEQVKRQADLEKLRPHLMQQAEEQGKRDAEALINEFHSSGNYMRAMRGEYDPITHTFKGPAVPE